MRPDLGPGGYAMVPRPMAALVPEGVQQMARRSINSTSQLCFRAMDSRVTCAL